MKETFELPGLKGFSEENIKLMRRFYEAWKEIEVKSVVRTTKNTKFNNQPPSPNSVVGTTELQTPDSEKDAIHGMHLTNDDRLSFENPSVGLILCKKADKAYVEYVLQDYQKPMGVATYQQMQDRLRELLPPEEEMKKLL